MRWNAYLAHISLVAGLLLLLPACRTEQKPKSQQTPQIETHDIDPKLARHIRERAEAYLEALKNDDFDAMWAMIDEGSKKKTGIAKFVRMNGYRNVGAFFGMRVASVRGIDEKAVLVKSVVRFQYFGTIFPDPDPTPVVFNWEEKWKLAPDGEWYRVIPEPDPERQKQLESVCSSKRRQ